MSYEVDTLRSIYDRLIAALIQAIIRAVGGSIKSVPREMRARSFSTASLINNLHVLFSGFPYHSLSLDISQVKVLRSRLFYSRVSKLGGLERF